MTALKVEASRLRPSLSRVGLVLLWGLAPILGLVAQAWVTQRNDGTTAAGRLSRF